MASAPVAAHKVITNVVRPRNLPSEPREFGKAEKLVIQPVEQLEPSAQVAEQAPTDVGRARQVEILAKTQREARRQEKLRRDAALAGQEEATRTEVAKQELSKLEAQQEEAKQELARQEAAKQELAKEEAVRQETARQQAADLEATRLEAAKQDQARQQVARVEAARQETAKQELAGREAAKREEARQEAARQEAARQVVARQEAARQEAARQEAARQETARQEVARQEAARQEAARQEMARQEAARQEVARQEAARQEAARQEVARQEAARQVVARQEAARQEAARQELAKKEQALAERAAQESAREDRLRQIGRQLDLERAQRENTADRQVNSPLPTASSLRRRWLFGRADSDRDLVLYADAMSRKIELNMTIDMVREVLKQPHTQPMVTIAVRADGSVEKVTFEVSSGVPALDDAIRKVIASQAPYGAFSPSLARRYDVIEIRRTWVFDYAIRLQ
ncbi:histone H1-like repetitive region-containing protein [Telluria mixta]|uniref:Histone H1-like repetitive region-containing protein n=1 Tax=Telluria mixta TaxID=34071 RepID=A0ABT2BSW3_9BURK|nr:histone H1-like repetitive region-containing protein [Telluria mixta]MCS0628205.1 histone H1-like repetitive region-containing protein [Telluria mixta]WEM93681.1 histone H1-like repetitive region-containing protein [Telluria mixta]